MYYYQYPRIGFGGILLLSSTSVALALLSATLSLLVAGVLLLRRKPPRPLNQILVSMLAVVIALTYVWAV